VSSLFLRSFRAHTVQILTAIEATRLDLTIYCGNHGYVLWLRGILGAVLAILVVGLTPIAYADPPDPTWLGGYWDDDDFDNVVAFIASAAAVVASPVIDGRPFGVAKHCVELARSPVRSASFLAFAPPRAPPVALDS
jgi:hypothetical protein